MFDPLSYADLQDTGNAQAQLVLIAIARHCDWVTGECFPKQETIAKMSKCCGRTVRRYMKKLAEDGFIDVAPRRRDDGGRTSDLITLKGYREWAHANQNGGTVARPRSVKRYQDPPDKLSGGGVDNLSAPPGHVLSTPPGQQVSGQEHSLNNQLTKASANDLVLEVKSAAAQPELRLVPSDGGKWDAWMAFLSPEQFDQAEAAGVIFVTAYWPDSKGARLVRIGKPHTLTDRSKAMAGEQQ